MWRKKISEKQKAKSYQRKKQQLKSGRPHRSHFASEAQLIKWCKKENKTPAAIKTYIKVFSATTTQYDTFEQEDLRKVPKGERVHRQFYDEPKTPPHYWDIKLEGFLD